MIPISADAVLKVQEPESGTTLHLRYITGPHADRFLELQGGNNLEKYRTAAARNVAAQNHGKRGRELAKLVVEEMARLAAQDGNAVSGARAVRMGDVIDLILVGWDSAGGWPAFPADGHPSTLFRMGDLAKLYEIIEENLGELSAISVDEAKN